MKERHEKDTSISKCGYLRYTILKLKTLNDAQPRIFKGFG